MLHWPKKSLVMPFYYINFDQNGPPYLILCLQYYHSSSEPLLIRSQACTHNLPKLLRTPLMLSLMEQPLTRAEPDEAGNNPVSMDIRVVLPAPLCPSRAVIWPSYMFSDTPLTATFFPIK